MMDSVSIIEYSDKYKIDFKLLNLEWIEKDYIVEPTDEEVLLHPDESIIDKGGFIYFAKMGDKIIGTCALLKINEKTFEIAKMAVTENYQRHGIGKILMNKILDKSKELKLDKLILYTHTKLEKALKMYNKYGFHEIPKEDFHNNRANIKMELELT
ncbi:GNAT family N-acetyltransferase [Saccharicrinis sp. FJH2]|uniref:GNAT family N-acetyltransferase n=1 Tax=Saccharicrinis sp. FJH65 TaxID=3344659 RepID=UPI0035F2B072